MEKQYSAPSEAPLKYLFKPAEHPNALEIANQEGIEVHMSEDGVYACACFYNTIDYNDFRMRI